MHHSTFQIESVSDQILRCQQFGWHSEAIFLQQLSETRRQKKQFIPLSDLWPHRRSKPANQNKASMAYYEFLRRRGNRWTNLPVSQVFLMTRTFWSHRQNYLAFQVPPVNNSQNYPGIFDCHPGTFDSKFPKLPIWTPLNITRKVVKNAPVCGRQKSMVVKIACYIGLSKCAILIVPVAGFAQSIECSCAKCVCGLGPFGGPFLDQLPTLLSPRTCLS